MLVPDIDEFTLVLKSSKISPYSDEWDDIAYNIIDEFTEITSMNELFGNHEEVSKGSAGYTNHYTYPEQIFSGLNMAWNTDSPSMGVIISFSASAWLFYRKYYEERFNEVITVPEFLRMIEHDDWIPRLSRIDFLVDFKDEGMNVDNLYRSIERGTAEIRFGNGKKNPSISETVSSNGLVQTFYLGSRKKNTGLRFRLYDKKVEQISKGRSALRLEEAESLNDWVRLEVVFRSKYAHRLHEDLLKTQNDNDLKNLIVSAILSKYEFWYVKSDKMMKITKDMKNMINTIYTFENPKVKTVELEKMIKYQIKGNGLFPLLYKLDEVYGDGTSKEFMQWLYEKYEDNYIESQDDRAWLNKYKFIYQNEYSDLTKNTGGILPWEDINYE